MMVTSSVSDNHDVEALRARDPRAMEHLVRQESRRVYRVLYRMVHDAEEAQSLVQETFLIAFRNIDTFQERSKVSTWVCGIATKLALKSLHASKRYETCSEEEIDRLRMHSSLPPMAMDGAVLWDPEQDLERAERAAFVRAALDRLPLKMRTIIILRDLAGYSTKETALILCISECNARVRLHRARNALLQLLKPYFGRCEKQLVAEMN